MIILDIRIWYNFVDWIVKKEREKNLQVLWNVFLMLQTLWGLGCDNHALQPTSIMAYSINIDPMIVISPLGGSINLVVILI